MVNDVEQVVRIPIGKPESCAFFHTGSKVDGTIIITGKGDTGKDAVILRKNQGKFTYIMDKILVWLDIQVFGINLRCRLVVNLGDDVVAFRFGHQHFQADFFEAKAIIHIKMQIFSGKDNGNNAICMGTFAIYQRRIQGPYAAPCLGTEEGEFMMAELVGKGIDDGTATGIADEHTSGVIDILQFIVKDAPCHEPGFMIHIKVKGQNPCGAKIGDIQLDGLILDIKFLICDIGAGKPYETGFFTGIMKVRDYFLISSVNLGIVELEKNTGRISISIAGRYLGGNAL